jgi:UPF0716 family protein affecting phage T7 exclusion
MGRWKLIVVEMVVMVVVKRAVDVPWYLILKVLTAFMPLGSYAM